MATILNRQKALRPYNFDIDIYDRKNNLGESLTYKDATAVNNAVLAYLVTKKGSYLYRPTFGSPLDILEFKNLDILQISNYSGRIAQIIQNNFSRYISNVIVTLNPNYETKTIEVTLQYLSLLANETITNTLIKRAYGFNYLTEKKYVEVELEKENLIRWIEAEVMRQPKASLLYDSSVQSWVWNNYKLSKLGDANTTSWKTVQEIIFEYNSKV